jgi:hypothetical protein
MSTGLREQFLNKGIQRDKSVFNETEAVCTFSTISEYFVLASKIWRPTQASRNHSTHKSQQVNLKYILKLKRLYNTKKNAIFYHGRRKGERASPVSAFPPPEFKKKLKHVLGRASRLLCIHYNLYLIWQTETKTSVCWGIQAIFNHLRGFIAAITDGEEVWSMPLRVPQVARYINQISWRSVQALKWY